MNSEKVAMLIKVAVNYLMEADLNEENGWNSDDIDILEKLQHENFIVSFDEESTNKFDSNTLNKVDSIISGKLEEIDKKIKATDDDNKQKYLVMEEFAIKHLKKEIIKLYNE